VSQQRTRNIEPEPQSMTKRDALRFPHPGTSTELETGTTFTPKFDANGLIPAIVSDADTGSVLMFAWMNHEALALTLTTREAHFWSRSRRAQWKKGEDSGNTLKVVAAATDCDQDVVLLSVAVQGAGVACHTGTRSCFYREIEMANDGQTPFKLQTKA
jgi:phosphoribosyl-AMP cyclohydrolase